MLGDFNPLTGDIYDHDECRLRFAVNGDPEPTPRTGRMTTLYVFCTATLDGPIRFAVGHDETGLSVAESSLALLHYDGAQWVDVTESIDTEAHPIVGSSSSLSYFVTAERTTCCVGRVGDPNGSGTEAPTIGDISTMIDAKFISESCDGLISCFVAADVNQSGGVSAGCDDITIGDISMLIDYLFITGPTSYGPLNDCF
jgi:hypothetical protein